MRNKEFIAWRVFGALLLVPEILLIAQAVSATSRVIWIVSAIAYPVILIWAVNRWVGIGDGEDS